MLCVGMCIEDKARLFAEVRRVLRPGGGFGVYDVVHEGVTWVWRAECGEPNYVPYTRMGNLVSLAGTGARRPGLPILRGRVVADVSVEEAYGHARLAGLSLLAALREAAGGSLDNVARVGKVVGWVNAVPEFTEQAKVIDGCTDLFVEVFGERGRPARSVFGASTALGVTVIVEAVAEVA